MFAVVDRDDSNGDYFRLGNLNAGTNVQLRLVLPESSLLDPRLAIVAGDGSVVAETTTSVPALEWTVPNDAGAAYYARISATASTRSFLSTYEATIHLIDSVAPEILSTDLPAGPTSAFIDSIQLTLDEDFDPDTVNASGAFELREAGVDGSFDTGDDVLVAFNPLAYVSGSTIDIQLTHYPLPGGLYRFTAFDTLTDAFGNALSSDYVETITVESLPGFVIEQLGSDTAATGTPMPFASNFAGVGTIAGRGSLQSAGDLDFWSFEASAGQRLILDIDFPGSSNYATNQFVLTAPDQSTVLLDVQSDINSGYSSSGILPLTQTGTYSLRVDCGAMPIMGNINSA